MKFGLPVEGPTGQLWRLRRLMIVLREIGSLINVNVTCLNGGIACFVLEIFVLLKFCFIARREEFREEQNPGTLRHPAHLDPLDFVFWALMAVRVLYRIR